jgi:hypothetical protein
LPVILGHGHVGVFGLDKVEADDARVLRGDLKGEKSLGEYLLRRRCAEDLVEETDLYGAGGAGVGLAAVFILIACVEGVIQLFAIDGGFVAEACSQERVAEAAEIFAGGAGGVASPVLGGVGRGARPVEA